MRLGPEPVLDVDDIQGHILVGFGSAPQALAAYTAGDLVSAGRAIAHLANQGLFTPARALREYRKERSGFEAVKGNGPWFGIAVSHRLLASNGVPADFGDPWFTARGGMPGITELNDHVDEVSGRVGDDWVVGAPGRPVDILIVAAGGTETGARDAITAAESIIPTSWIEHKFVESLLPMQGSLEHFGFRDGISQPALLGTIDGIPFVDDRLLGNGPVPLANAGRELVWPGMFVFGLPDRDDHDPWRAGSPSALRDHATDAVARNGSYLVYRRLSQNVAAFRAFCVDQAAVLSRCFESDLSADDVAELLVGRHCNGVPLAYDANADVRDPAVLNGFTFAGDEMAAACPPAAHIRKVNPRLGQIDHDHVPRILRRGAPFGPPYVEGEAKPPGGGRGLAFLSYQTSIVGQFGFLMSRWMGAPNSPTLGGHDLIVGQVAPGISRFAAVAGPGNRPCRVAAGTAGWVRTTGGAFLFAPSLTLLRSLGTEVEL